MTKWVWKGLQTGIKTTLYPGSPETNSGVSPGRPCGVKSGNGDWVRSVTDECPTGALTRTKEGISLQHKRCINCFRCKRRPGESLHWEEGYEWGEPVSENYSLDKAFSRSLHIRIVDTGACGACLSEIKQIGSPYYNIHRLGFFVTPTPRAADVLLIAGPVTNHMRFPLKKTYEAMPTPKRVIAVGTCALSGGIFGPSFITGAGIEEIIPVDIEVAGCPPPPLAIIHALLVTAGRKKPQVSASSMHIHERREKR
jgi:Ni,Fe-hydrogenase III small subunit